MSDEHPATPSPESCLVPTRFIESAHPAILDRVERLRVGELPPAQRAAALFRFVRDEVRYEFMAKLTPQEYFASHILQEAKGFCVQKAVLLCALSRAAQVPCAIVLSDLVDHSLSPKISKALGTNVMFHHGLNAFYLEGRWLKADASLSPDLATRKGYHLVDFDGTAEALQRETTLSGRPHATYAQFHGTYADLPFEQMLNAFIASYAHADVLALSQLGFAM
ncbi:MAG: transglutaminase family protein [Archangium sp.]|nr:transglutaminase family protein [Archangium sp.]